MIRKVWAPAMFALGALALGGCANDGMMGSSSLTTASVQEQPRVDPACTALSAQIDALKKEGIADKIEKAAAKKYKMTAADLTRADQLNKTNAEFQGKCSTVPLRSAQATVGASGAAVAKAPAN